MTIGPGVPPRLAPGVWLSGARPSSLVTTMSTSWLSLVRCTSSSRGRQPIPSLVPTPCSGVPTPPVLISPSWSPSMRSPIPSGNVFAATTGLGTHVLHIGSRSFRWCRHRTPSAHATTPQQQLWLPLSWIYGLQERLRYQCRTTAMTLQTRPSHKWIYKRHFPRTNTCRLYPSVVCIWHEIYIHSYGDIASAVESQGSCDSAAYPLCAPATKTHFPLAESPLHAFLACRAMLHVCIHACRATLLLVPYVLRA